MLSVFLIAVVLSFVGSIAVAGPISVLVLYHTMEKRYRESMSVATGAALAEGLYAALAFLGMSTLLERFPIVATISEVVAIVVLFLVGGLLLRWKPSELAVPTREVGSVSRGIALGFTITAFNPAMLPMWSAVTATLTNLMIRWELEAWFPVTPLHALPFGLGIVSGVLIWFSLVIQTIRRYGHRIRQDVFVTIIRTIGVALLLAGVWMAWKAFEHGTR